MRFMSILFYLIYSLLYYDYTNTHIFDIFVASLTPGVRSSRSFGHKDLIHKSRNNPINCGGQVF